MLWFLVAVAAMPASQLNLKIFEPMKMPDSLACPRHQLGLIRLIINIIYFIEPNRFLGTDSILPPCSSSEKKLKGSLGAPLDLGASPNHCLIFNLCALHHLMFLPLIIYTCPYYTQSHIDPYSMIRTLPVDLWK